ncbi:MAG TPA: S8 family serine peptidase, partial [Pirellulaceae bacterium]|nr:S8 family serine peptidase [Pirellulaceae bacterium]
FNQSLFAQATADEIGLTALRHRLGAASPTGDGVAVMLVEGLTSANSYMPDRTTPELANKNITDRSSNGSNSTHATSVASIGFGSHTGIAPGVSRIDVFKVFDLGDLNTDWLGGSYLRFGGGLPAVETELRVQNHSWAAGATFDASTVEVMRRLDYAVHRDNVVAVAGIANAKGSAVPPMLGSTYNAIIVGNSNGNSSHGPTGGEIAGRSKPDIVGPYGVSSYSTPVVSGCAALLVQTADLLGNPNRGRTETIKAILLSGATKDVFAGLANPWNRVDNGQFVEPLDRRFGAGLVNINNSHLIISSSEQNGTDLIMDSPIGWDWETLTETDNIRRYFFELGNVSDVTFSATATWLRRIHPTGAGANLFETSEATLSTIELRLFEANQDMSLGNLIDTSLSPIDNVQHIFRTDLPGNQRYALEVRLAGLPTGQLSENFSGAWFTSSVPVPEPSTFAVCLFCVIVVLARRTIQR